MCKKISYSIWILEIMNTKKLLDNLTINNPDYMRKLYNANEVTLTECFNNIKRNKAVINFHLSTYMFQQQDLYNPIELAAALIDLQNSCTLIINRLNDLK